MYISLICMDWLYLSSKILHSVHKLVAKAKNLDRPGPGDAFHSIHDQIRVGSVLTSLKTGRL